MIEITLSYKRDVPATTSSGTITAMGIHKEFAGIEFKEMMRQVAGVLQDTSDACSVIIQRTDRAGLLPYKLDDTTIELLKKDPVAGIEAMSFTSPSPSRVAEQVKERAVLPPVTVLRVGTETLSDVFGDVVFFRIRGAELECPCCGFWGRWALPSMLADTDRIGTDFKAMFRCPKKCKQRFSVQCSGVWGTVRVDELLETNVLAFYLPRGWNNHRPWVSREDLTKRYVEYLAEKENAK